MKSKKCTRRGSAGNGCASSKGAIDNLDIIYASGFAFLRDLGNGCIEFENKFTGLRLVYDVKTGTKMVKEAAI